MGQIIIDLPLDIESHYVIDDPEAAAEMIDALENTARRFGECPDKQIAEDLADIRAAKRARQGKSISLKALEKSLDLLDW